MLRERKEFRRKQGALVDENDDLFCFGMASGESMGGIGTDMVGISEIFGKGETAVLGEICTGAKHYGEQNRLFALISTKEK